LLLEPTGDLLRVADLLSDQTDHGGVRSGTHAGEVRVVTATRFIGLAVRDLVVIAQVQKKPLVGARTPRVCSRSETISRAAEKAAGQNRFLAYG
jgi:hypothetical protein